MHGNMEFGCWMQGPEYIWVDNSGQCRHLLQELFPTVKRVLEDSTHLMRRYLRTLTPNHPSNRKPHACLPPCSRTTL